MLEADLLARAAGDGMQSFDQQILAVLRDSSRSLKSKEIARQINTAFGASVTKKDVNQRLFGTLKSLVLKDTAHQWSLIEADRKHTSMTPLPLEPEAPHPDDRGDDLEEVATEPEAMAEQDRVIHAPAEARILVQAPPGAGKTYVACSRVASLVKRGIRPNEILMISFTRTAVAEIRDRIADSLDDQSDASRVRISTVDSHAWNLRVGFEAQETQHFGGSVDFDSNLERVIELMSDRDEHLHAFLSRLRHVLIDEAQDVVGVRAQFIRRFLEQLDSSCGITILADSDQAIYGFTNDEEDDEGAGAWFIDLLHSDREGSFERIELTRNFRTSNQELLGLIQATRQVLHRVGVDASERLKLMHDAVREGCERDTSSSSASDLAGNEDALVLYRRRAEVLMASSYLSNEGIEHRLRLSGMPPVVQPWIGRLLSSWTSLSLTRTDFERLWTERFVPHIFGDLQPGEGWRLLHRLAGDGASRVSLRDLRRVLSSSRPPVELCAHECGLRGPILGTIHASKGREAGKVRLMLPSRDGRGTSPEQIEEECRVVYVGATRAIRVFEVGAGFAFPTSMTRGGRIYRRLKGKGKRVQIEIGLNGDVDVSAHCRRPNAEEIQESIAALCGSTRLLIVRATPATDWRHRLFVHDSTAERCVGEVGDRLLNEIWIGRDRAEHKVGGVYMIGATTTAISDDDDAVLQRPYDASRIFLTPVIKAFTTANLAFGAQKQ